MPEPGQISLIIYNILGQEIRSLINAYQPAGDYRVSWNGRDNLGRTVASGHYVYRLIHPSGILTRDMTLLK